jgi:hypothetical protein
VTELLTPAQINALVEAVETAESERDALETTLRSILHRFRHSDSQWRADAAAVLSRLKKRRA